MPTPILELRGIGISVSKLDLFAAAVALGLVGLLCAMFTGTRMGLALRAA